MTVPGWLVPALLALAVVLGWARLALWQARAPASARAPMGRLALLLLLQPLAALLLWLTLHPPPLPGAAGTLVVATPGAGATAALTPGDVLVALPRTGPVPGAVAVPDLATALRRYPGMRLVRVVGQGLPARDRAAAAAGPPIRFAPQPLPPGLTALALPDGVAPGAAFRVGGTLGGVPGGSVDLLDPAGRVVDHVVPGGDGSFRLGGSAGPPGPARFALRLRDAGGKPVEEVPVPVVTVAERGPRLLVVAGAAGPDLKYLRRWATDAGATLATRVTTGGGLAIGDPVAIDAATLAHADLLVLDERSWGDLGGGERSAVLAAVRGGLGLLLRVTGPVAPPVRAQWATLGLPLAADDAPVPFRLRRGDPAAEPELSRYRLGPVGRDAVPLLRDAGGETIALWRGLGAGRIGLLPVPDLHVLALAGEAGRHGMLWSAVAGTLARPQGPAPPTVVGPAWVGERVVLCDLPAGASVVAPDGGRSALLVDPAAGGGMCAGFWPRVPGWHDIVAGAAVVPMLVWPADVAPALAAAERRDATLALAASPRAAHGAPPPSGSAGPAWPWFLGWLATAGLLWWLERRGRDPAR